VDPGVGEHGLLGERAEPVHGCGRQGGTFDRNGNLTGDGVWAYGYDLDNRMKTASRPGTGATLAYDPEGRLVRTTVNGVETNLLYDGQNLVGEYDGAGRLTRRYVFGPGVDAPLVQYEGAATNTKSWLYANQQGSVVALANATGATTASQGYGPFGETEGIPGSRFGYTGQQYLAALGLYYYKARMYSPGLGRFLQTDPVGYADDLNWYAYVGNNPVNFTDPTGHWLVNAAMGALNAEIGFGVSWATGERNPYTLAVNAGVDFVVGFVAGPVAGSAAKAGVQLAARTGQNAASTITKVQTGSLFALGATGEVAKTVMNPGSASTAQTMTGAALAGVVSAAPGIGTALSAAGKVSGLGTKIVTGIENTYSGAATGLVNSAFSSTVGKTTSASGFK
jgi:RHS repeat-associated protein